MSKLVQNWPFCDAAREGRRSQNSPGSPEGLARFGSFGNTYVAGRSKYVVASYCEQLFGGRSDTDVPKPAAQAIAPRTWRPSIRKRTTSANSR